MATPKSKRVKTVAGANPTASSSRPVQPLQREEGGKEELAAIKNNPKYTEAIISTITDLIRSGKTEDLRKTFINVLESEFLTEGLDWVKSAWAMYRQSLPEGIQRTAYETTKYNAVGGVYITLDKPIPIAIDLTGFLYFLVRFQSSESQSSEIKMGVPPERRRTVLELASDVLENPGEWLRTQNSQLGDRKPIDLIGTNEEEKVFNLLNAVDQGLF